MQEGMKDAKRIQSFFLKITTKELSDERLDELFKEVEEMEELLETKPILINHAQMIAVCKYYAKKHRYHELTIDFE